MPDGGHTQRRHVVFVAPRKKQREQIWRRVAHARHEIRIVWYVINNVRSFMPQIWRKYITATIDRVCVPDVCLRTPTKLR